VPAGALALGRARQIVKPGWAVELGKRRAAKRSEEAPAAEPVAAKAHRKD
jgi:hypothetical protein